MSFLAPCSSLLTLAIMKARLLWWLYIWAQMHHAFWSKLASDLGLGLASGEKGGGPWILTKGHPCLECDLSRGGPHTLAMALFMSMFDDLYFFVNPRRLCLIWVMWCQCVCLDGDALYNEINWHSDDILFYIYIYILFQEYLILDT